MTEAVAPANGDVEESLRKRMQEGPRGGGRTWYEVLEVPADVGAADLHKAYDRALALVDGRSIGGYLMLDPLAAERARTDVEAAFFVLGDAERRKGYDDRLRAPQSAAVAADAPHSIGTAQTDKDSAPTGLRFTAPAEPSEATPAAYGPPGSPPPAATAILFAPPTTAPGVAAAEDTRTVDALSVLAVAAEAISPAAVAQPPVVVIALPGSEAPDALPDSGPIAGALIRAIREARGMTLEELAEATKIRRPYLSAVEQEDLVNLPARVYLRGFLTQVARVLKLDRARLAEGYLLTVERLSKSAPPLDR